MIRRLLVVIAVISSLSSVAAPAVASENPLCLVRPQWCETP